MKKVQSGWKGISRYPKGSSHNFTNPGGMSRLRYSARPDATKQQSVPAAMQVMSDNGKSCSLM